LNLSARSAVSFDAMGRTAVMETERMAIRDGDATRDERETAFARLADAHLDAAYRLATFILAGDRGEAEDAVNDAALQAWEHYSELRDPARFEAWFTRILVNECRDRIGKRRLRPITLADPDPGATPDHADALLRSDALARAMLSLSPEHRVVVALRYVHDLPLEEIAARTGERLVTVKSRLHYALRQMRASLEAEGRDAEGRDAEGREAAGREVEGRGVPK
jgi:RNA polymerase sigma-70 factor (ECF subfamily)